MSVARRLCGAVLLLVGLGWFLGTLPLAAVRLAENPEDTLATMAGAASGMLLFCAAGLLPAALGRALLRPGRPVLGPGAAVATGSAWFVCMSAAASAGTETAAGFALAALGLLPVVGAGSDAFGRRGSEASRAGADALPRPSAWPPEWAPKRWSLLVVVPIGLGSAAMGIGWALSAGRTVPGLFALSLGLFLLVVGFGLAPLRISERHRGLFPARSAVRESTGEPALLVPVSPRFRLVTALAVVLFGAFGVTGVGTAVLEGAEGLRPAAAGAAALALLAVGAAALLRERVRARRNRQRRGGGGLLLTPEEVLYGWGALGGACRWDEAVGVFAEKDHRGDPVVTVRAHPAESLAEDGASPRARPTTLRINPGLLQCDPLLLYHVLRFYHEVPERRHELGTPAAPERIAARDLPRH